MSKVYEGFITVGKIRGVFGYKGWVKVSAYSGVKDRFAKVKAVYIDSGKELERKVLTGQKYFQKQLLLKFADLNDRETPRALIGRELYLPESEIVELPADSFFIHDLVGLAVYDVQKGYLGILKDVMFAGSHQLLVVQSEEREILVPAVEEFVREVDLKKGKVLVRLWEDM